MKNRYFNIALAASTLLLSACSSGESTDLANHQQRLDDNLNKWHFADIQDYRYNFRRSCFCWPDYTRELMIQYRKGTYTSTVYADDLSTSTESANTLSIENLFLIIQNAIDNQETDLYVSYHPQFGFPTTVSRDPIPEAIDDEITYQIDHLKTNGTLYTSAFTVSNTTAIDAVTPFTLNSANIVLANSDMYNFDSLQFSVSTNSSCGNAYFRMYISTEITNSLSPQASSRIIRYPNQDELCDTPQEYQIVVDLSSYKQKLIQQGISDIVLNIDSFSVRYQF